MKLKLESAKRKRLSESFSAEDISRALEILDRENFFCSIEGLNEDVPFAWDNVAEVKGDNIIIHGGVVPGGPGYGKVTIEIPLSKFSKHYEIRFEEYYDLDDYDTITDEERDLLKRVCSSF